MAASQQKIIPRIPQVDGVRALSTLSMVALHATVIGTLHTTVETREWSQYVHSPIFGVLRLGGCQVDALLVLSGLLLGLHLRKDLVGGSKGEPGMYFFDR